MFFLESITTLSFVVPKALISMHLIPAFFGEGVFSRNKVVHILPSLFFEK